MVGHVLTECIEAPELAGSGRTSPFQGGSKGHSRRPSHEHVPIRPSKTLATTDVKLRAGDTLLLEAPVAWVQKERMTHHWLRAGVVKNEGRSAYGARYGSTDPDDVASRRKSRFKLLTSIVCLITLLVLSGLDLVELLDLTLILSFVSIGIAEIITLDQAWRAISYRLLLTISSSFGPGAALTNTGVAAVLGFLITKVAVAGPWVFLFVVYLVTALLSSMISNSACVIAMYQVLRTVVVPGVGVRQMMIVMVLGASCAFATPIGYQTNLMVLARGPYEFADFIKVGGGLVIAMGVTCATFGLFVPII